VNPSAIPFELRGSTGVIEVVIDANQSPAELGCGLLSSEVSADLAIGFPVCTAKIQYERDGYAAALGWIQLVRCTDGASNGDVFELDPLALLRDVDTPYAFFGVKPILFDAPFRTNHVDLDWQADSFLCFSPDAVMTKQVHAVAGFSWGFRLEDDDFSFQAVQALAPDDWNGHLSTLTTMFPSWTFRPGFRSF
jgi:hypothetical protein